METIFFCKMVTLFSSQTTAYFLENENESTTHGTLYGHSVRQRIDKVQRPSEGIHSLYIRIQTLPFISEISLQFHGHVIGPRPQDNLLPAKISKLLDQSVRI